jgi:hypothetical protein
MPLERARRGAIDSFRKVLSIAPVGLLDKQPAQVLFTVPLGFLASKERCKTLMKSGEVCCHPVKLSLIHVKYPSDGHHLSRELYVMQPSL